MPHTYNIYCDESCNLEHPQQQCMVLCAIWCPLERTGEVAARIREIRVRHGLAPDLEIKWTKVSPGRLLFYLDLVDLFFDDDDLHLRALVVPDASQAWQASGGLGHDGWYCSMLFALLQEILRPDALHRIYLDYNDTRGPVRVAKLRRMLAQSSYDFRLDIVERIQVVRSHEVALLQMTDLLAGAIAYANRGLATSQAKLALLDRIRSRSGYKLTQSTLPREEKLSVRRLPAAQVRP